MTGNQTLIARAILGIVAGTTSVVAVSNARLRAMPSQQFDRTITAVFVVSRLALFLGLFVILRVPPRGDIPGFYWSQAVQVLRGLAPYHDFVSSYAPLHAYLDAALVRLWYSPLSIILFSLLAECLILPLWLHLGRDLFAEEELRTAALLYLTSVASLQFVAIDGQDNVIIAALLAFAILWLRNGRSVLSGAAVGLGSVATKFLPLVYAPLFFIAATRRWRWAAGLALPVVLVYGGFAAKHLDVLSVLSNEGGLKSANNLTYLIEAILGITIPSRVWDGLMATALLLIFALVARAVAQAPPNLHLQPLVFGTAAITLAIVLLAKKSWPPYLVLALFPICLLIPAGSRLKIATFALFGVVVVVAPSYWATVLSQFSAKEFHQGLLAGELTCYIFLALQTSLVAGYVWLFIASLRRIVISSRTT